MPTSRPTKSLLGWAEDHAVDLAFESLWEGQKNGVIEYPSKHLVIHGSAGPVSAMPGDSVTVTNALDPGKVLTIYVVPEED